MNAGWLVRACEHQHLQSQAAHYLRMRKIKKTIHAYLVFGDRGYMVMLGFVPHPTRPPPTYGISRKRFVTTPCLAITSLISTPSLRLLNFSPGPDHHKIRFVGAA